MNPHISHVYELYYSAFEKLRKVPEIKTLEDNDKFCVRHYVCWAEKIHLLIFTGCRERMSYGTPDGDSKASNGRVRDPRVRSGRGV